MTEAIFGLIGVLFGSLVSYFAQVRATRLAIDAELRRMDVEYRLREYAKRNELIREWAAEILVECDPDVNATVNYRKIVTNIHRLQLILDTSGNKAHAIINDAINKLGMSFQTKSATRESTYAFQNQIIESVKAMNGDLACGR
jgi:hypothetical protein